MTEETSQVNNSLLKLIKRLIKLINNKSKSRIERLTKLLKALIYSLFVLIKSFTSFMEGLTEGHTKRTPLPPVIRK